MLTQEEIEESKSVLNDLVEDENVYNSIKKAVAGTFTYIEQLENKVKEAEEYANDVWRTNSDLVDKVEQLENKVKEQDKVITEINNEKHVAQIETEQEEYASKYNIAIQEVYVEMKEDLFKMLDIEE